MTTEITIDLVRRLVRAQFPRWGELGVHALAHNGWDNGTFRLGHDRVVRLPRASARLCGVIDFGQSCVGDPACDLVPAWTLFDAESRNVFLNTVALDKNTVARARGWALWKALIIAARLTETDAWEGSRCWNTIETLLLDHAQTAAWQVVPAARRRQRLSSKV